MKKPTVVVIKSSSWKTAYQSKNHPEYLAIFDLVHHYEFKIHFVLVGTSGASTRGVQLENGTTAWDIQAPGRLWHFTYYLDLMKLLFKCRPTLVIVLGLLNILPVALYSLLSWRSKYVPVFIGEFGYYGEKRAGQLLTILGFKTLGMFLRLSQRKMINTYTLSSFTKKSVEHLAPSLNGKLRLISYPISPIFCPDQKGITPKHSDEPILLTVAGIEPRKGLDTLIKAVSLLSRKMRVIVKGGIRNDAYMHKLRTMVKNLKVEEKITFVTDIIDYDALASYYRSATLFVFPTKDDCLGVVILEALHCGVPVIATSVGGIPDMIENGINGILVKPDNPRELANAILLLLDDDALRRKLAANARLVLTNRYYQGRITLKEALMQSISELDRR